MPQPRSEPERAPDEPRAAVASPLDAHHATAVAAPAGAQTRTPAPSARPAAPAMAAVPEDSASAGPRSVAIGEMRCRTPEPAYPLASRRLGEQGTVRVRLLIDESGLPQQVELAASSGFERLDRVALEASRATRCVPYTADGRAIRVTAVRPFVFRLD